MTGQPKAYEDLISELKKEIIEAIQSSMVPVRYMSLKQAVVYSGIGQKQLISLAQQGKIKGRKVMRVKRADWSFDKESIDAYWHSPFTEAPAQAKSVLDRIKRRG